ncbi:MAG: hypothetical protein A3E78_13965 [Alphaproteobacteria bacterium RIFCSPHIGHO2_12_FULL_63_12]|nr:MAG: hypothetical protein A3E78_13965 [Alphaproteobacteria bacterium RIFCSPHIGHO2_12_FULL_63_12]
MNMPKRPALAAVPDDDLTRDSSGQRFRSRSYLSVATAIRENTNDVLEGRQLELNEMTGRVELDRVPLRDGDVSHVRAELERRIIVNVAKDGERIGLQASKDDVFSAMNELAQANVYHPVREYLSALTWDGVERIKGLIGTAICAQNNNLNRSLVRRLLIAMVARAMKPGCKLDTVLVLVGLQGIGKSTLFRILASPAFFVDSPIDIDKKDALEQLRHAWLIEWAELESLFRARDSTAVKAFLSSCADTYRPSYGRNVITVPRSCVIVGTTNADEFLTDETGNRRFWPLKVAGVDVVDLAAQRDQVWAEAFHLFQQGEQWWLTTEEERLLSGSHEQHRVHDAWEERVLSWAEECAHPFTTTDVLEKAIEKPVGQWGRADEMRVAKILKSAGWTRKTDPDHKQKGKRWTR